MHDPLEWSKIVHEIYHGQQHSKSWGFGLGPTFGLVKAVADVAMSTLRVPKTLAMQRTGSRTDRDVSDEHEIPYIREAMERAGHLSDGDFFRKMAISQTDAYFAHSTTMLRSRALEWLLSRITEVAAELAETTSRKQLNRWKEGRAATRDREQLDHSRIKLGELRMRINSESATDGTG